MGNGVGPVDTASARRTAGWAARHGIVSGRVVRFASVFTPTERRNGKSLRRLYRATPLGRKALAASRNKVRELFHELIEGEDL